MLKKHRPAECVTYERQQLSAVVKFLYEQPRLLSNSPTLKGIYKRSSSHLHADTHLSNAGGFYYQLRMRRGNTFDRVCVSVCLSVCLSVLFGLIACNSVYLETSLPVCWYIFPNCIMHVYPNTPNRANQGAAGIYGLSLLEYFEIGVVLNGTI